MNIIAVKKINASDIALVPPDLMVDEVRLFVLFGVLRNQMFLQSYNEICEEVL